MIWLPERIAAFVVIILILRSWWHSQAWLPTAMAFVLNGAGRIVQGFALVLHLCALYLRRVMDTMDLLVRGLARPTHDRMADSNQSSRARPTT